MTCDDRGQVVAKPPDSKRPRLGLALWSDPAINKYMRLDNHGRYSYIEYVKSLRSKGLSRDIVAWWVYAGGDHAGSIGLWNMGDYDPDGLMVSRISDREMGDGQQPVRRVKGGRLYYIFHQHFHGKGIALPAVTAALDYAFCYEKLEVVMADVFCCNVPSLGLATKLGFVHHWTEENVVVEAEERSDLWHGILRQEDWLAR